MKLFVCGFNESITLSELTELFEGSWTVVAARMRKGKKESMRSLKCMRVMQNGRLRDCTMNIRGEIGWRKLPTLVDSR